MLKDSTRHSRDQIIRGGWKTVDLFKKELYITARGKKWKDALLLSLFKVAKSLEIKSRVLVELKQTNKLAKFLTN